MDRKLKLTWLVPDDRGGGVISVALSCVRQAHAAGHEVTLLLVLPPTGWLDPAEYRGCTLATLGLGDGALDTPTALLRWLEAYPQDVLVLNACEQANPVIPYLPPNLRCLYAVHDTAMGHWQTAVQFEEELDVIIAVSEVTARQFRDRLREPAKLHVVHNGSLYPAQPVDEGPRAQDMVFPFGDNQTKGADDLIKLWVELGRSGFAGALHWYGEMRPEFKRQVRALPGAERICLYGRVQRAELFAAAARCRVFLMLSRADAFGMVTVETMSMGCVPVAWEIDTGTREIVPEGLGCFAPLGDFPALATAVWRALELQPVVGPAEMARAREDFNEETMWGGYARVVAAAMERPAALRPLVGKAPAAYQPPRRYFQKLPRWLRGFLRNWAGRSPRLGYWVRNLRGR